MTRKRRSEKVDEEEPPARKEPLARTTAAASEKGIKGKDIAIPRTRIDLFSTLPDEMVVSIFSYLGIADGTLEVSQVGRRFRRLSVDPITKLTITDYFSFHRKVLTSFLPLSRLRELRILVDREETEAAEPVLPMTIAALRRCPRLESLTLSYCHLAHLLCPAIEAHGVSLRRLYLTGDSNLIDPTSLRSLTHLHLGCATRLENKVLLAIGRHCKVLECFKLIHSREDDDEGDEVFPEADDNETTSAVASFLRSVRKSLKELAWKDDWGFSGLSLALEECQLLESLDIIPRHCYLRLPADLLRTALQRLPRLKNLAFRAHSPFSHQVEEDFCGAFADSKEFLGNLTGLELDGTYVDDDLLKVVGKVCPRLQRLTIGYITGGVSGVSLVNFASLERIVLDSKYLSMTYLADVAKSLIPNLKYLEHNSDKCDQAVVKQELWKLGVKVARVNNNFHDLDLLPCRLH